MPNARSYPNSRDVSHKWEKVGANIEANVVIKPVPKNKLETYHKNSLAHNTHTHPCNMQNQ